MAFSRLSREILSGRTDPGERLVEEQLRGDVDRAAADHEVVLAADRVVGEGDELLVLVGFVVLELLQIPFAWSLARRLERQRQVPGLVDGEVPAVFANGELGRQGGVGRVQALAALRSLGLARGHGAADVVGAVLEGQLVRRQRESLADLARQRDAFLQQIESAGLALGTLRLDLVKYRASGGQAALAHVSSATQEARALSRDIGAMLDVQAELRRL